MDRPLKRKLNTTIRFIIARDPRSPDVEAIITELLQMLTAPEQHAVLRAALRDAVAAVVKADTAEQEKAESQQMELPFPDFPHVTAFVEIGEQVIEAEYATAEEIDVIIEALERDIEAQEQKLNARLEQAVKPMREKLDEWRKLRSIVRRAGRYNPNVTVGEAMARRRLKVKAAAHEA